ncbi:MAG TPA: ADOP family duplicated permease [Vicinamibacterales bacterium]|nr:ADOP family duplicated permease [Vicinamibacterales bacterium]
MRTTSIVARLFRREPGLAATVAAIFALGIGAGVSVFAVAHAVVLRPLPFADQERLVVMWERDDRRDVAVWEVSYRNFRDWSAQATSFTGLAGMGSVTWSTRLARPDGPVTLPLAAVSSGFFDVLGVRPAAGRPFTPAEDRRGAPAVAVISDGTWRTHFGGDPGIVGRGVMLDAGEGPRLHTVVGVMGPEFDFPRGAAVWMPLAPVLGAASAQAGFDTLESRGLGVLYVVGRLRKGIALVAAGAEMDAIVSRLSPDPTGRRAVLTPLAEYVIGPARQVLWLLLCAIGIVLALMCANVVGLLLSRLAARRRAIAISIALGAGRRHLLRVAAAEAAALAGCGVAGALLLASWALPALIALVPSDVPRLADATSIGPAVLTFTLLVGLVCAAICSVIPTAAAFRQAPFSALRAGDRGSRPALGARGALVVVQVSLSVVLLVAANLTARSFRAIRGVDLGFDSAGIMTADVSPGGEHFGTDVNRLFYGPVLERIRAMPGVTGAAGIYLRPFELGPIGSDEAVLVEGLAADRPESWHALPTVNAETVSTDYFEVMKVRVVRGRAFTEADRRGTLPVVVLSESSAARLWPGQDPVGRKLMASTDRRTQQWQTVVGVVRDVRYRGIGDPRLDLYRPYLQSSDDVKHVMIQAPAGALSLERLRDVVRTVDPRAVVEGLRPMTQVVAREYAPWRFGAVLFSLLAALATILALMGLYASLSAIVSERTKEIGIRKSLGARSPQVIALVLGRVVVLVGNGLVIGTIASLAVAPGLERLLFGVRFLDPAAYLFTGSLLTVAALCAAWRPARRAASVDPLIALRAD